MKKFIIAFLLLGFSVLAFAAEDGQEAGTKKEKELKLKDYIRKLERSESPSVDHSKFDQLKKPFNSPQEVTEACLGCHTERGKEVMATSHWNWERSENIEGKGVVPLGKKNILNNFCIGIAGSEGTCTRCHIGYGWKDNTFDFANEFNIDCLVCHDNSGTYEKAKGAAGYPKAEVDLNRVAQNVGSPSKENCGVCHFYGGGGNNVKHGDLEKGILGCSKDVDVHMAIEGEDMSCVECHKTEKHQMAGKLYALSSENTNRATCAQCHGESPHKTDIINDHNIRVACQTCHIPIYAKVNGTKMIWDWSTAGQLNEDGSEKHEYDADENHNYLSIKGNFVYNDNVVPEYFWFNGIANHQLITDKIDTIPVQMNSLDGSYRDKGRFQKTNQPSKIWPVKVHRGKQLYDTEHMTLIQPKLWDKEEGNGAYWTDFDWEKAASKGMEYVEQEYSGNYGFVETEMYWPLNHMVSPAEQSLKCIDCHTRKNGRLAKLDDFYLPGRDQKAGVEILGISLIVLSLLGIIVHAILRVIGRKCCMKPPTKDLG
jgi:octaheme c-type cytochrome (tetrathionate reductase family)